MTTLTSSIRLEGVTMIDRRGIGPVYRAQISVGTLYRAIRRSTIRYAPKYQRGYKNFAEKTEADLEMLLPVTHPDLQLDDKRAMAMAIKYLDGRLYTSHVTWNARREDDVDEPRYDRQTSSLEIESAITIPDTGHRHLAYYLLGFWKENPEEVPVRVVVDDTPVDRDWILDKLEEIDLDQEFVYCDVYVLDPEAEGFLYDEFNADSKPPATAVAISLNPTKTPSRRFVTTLLNHCPIFSPEEVETRGNVIGSKSRKLTTNSTLEGAVRPMRDRLVELEKDKGGYNDLVDFSCAFFNEYAKLFPAFQPGASGEERRDLREHSFAGSNIMFHPLFRLIFELWDEYHSDHREWKNDNKWKDAVARLGGEVTAKHPDKGVTVVEPLMSRDNPDWIGRILIKQFNQNGEVTDYSLSSTRQTRDAAYYYLREKMGLAPAPSETVSAEAGA
jgi:hypothetical protein